MADWRLHSRELVKERVRTKPTAVLQTEKGLWEGAREFRKEVAKKKKQTPERNKSQQGVSDFEKDLNRNAEIKNHSKSKTPWEASAIHLLRKRKEH